VRDRIDAVNAWELDTKAGTRHGRYVAPSRIPKFQYYQIGDAADVALCRLLLKERDVLLIDEPTNHLDAGIYRLAGRHLQQYKGTIYKR